VGTVLSRYGLSTGVAAALLAGCGGSQAGGAGAFPVGTTPQAKTHRHSWMLPEAKSDDLLYVSDDNGDVYVYSYPKLQRVGQLTGLGNLGTQGLCVDRQGDVFVPAWTPGNTLTGYIYEFAHGGTLPIETLTDGTALNTSCSVDPTTGDLAVTDFMNVEIFQNAQGTPTAYDVPNIEPQWSAYDDDGNLFVDGYNENNGTPLAELVKGSSTFTPVTLNQPISMFSLQWDKGYLTIASGNSPSRDAEYVYQVKVSDGAGTIAGTTTLKTHHVEYDGNGQYWIQGRRVMGAGRLHDSLDLWPYPSGGKAIRVTARHVRPWGVVVSVAPSFAHPAIRTRNNHGDENHRS
jgi:hypothetical protein